MLGKVGGSEGAELVGQHSHPGSHWPHWPPSDRLLATRKLLRALTARDDGRTVRAVFLYSQFLRVFSHHWGQPVSQPASHSIVFLIDEFPLYAPKPLQTVVRLEAGLSVKMSGGVSCCCVIMTTLQDVALVSCQPGPGPSLTALLISTGTGCLPSHNWLIHSWESWPTDYSVGWLGMPGLCLVSSTWILFDLSLSLTHCRFI